MEHPIWGIGRIGTAKPGYVHLDSLAADTIYTRELGEKYYELQDHLGTARMTISDIKLPLAGPGAPPYEADVRTFAHTYPYGMLHPKRSYNAGEYRWGFNGLEQEKQLKGFWNHFGVYLRQYDPRLARWWSPDPVTHPWESPYAAMAGNPVALSDPIGAEPDSANGTGTGTGSAPDPEVFQPTIPDGAPGSAMNPLRAEVTIKPSAWERFWDGMRDAWSDKMWYLDEEQRHEVLMAMRERFTPENMLEEAVKGAFQTQVDINPMFLLIKLFQQGEKAVETAKLVANRDYYQLGRVAGEKTYDLAEEIVVSVILGAVAKGAKVSGVRLPPRIQRAVDQAMGGRSVRSSSVGAELEAGTKPNINPGYSETNVGRSYNCINCAIATDATFAGRRHKQCLC